MMGCGFVIGTPSKPRLRADRARACRVSATQTPIAGAETIVEARSRILQELELIEGWERDKNLGTRDPWAHFLRACVCARADFINEAVSFFRLSQNCGFNKGPEPHYRIASALFRQGSVKPAASIWDLGALQATEMVGNENHFGHLFQRKYSQFLPVWYGPSRGLERAACYYCSGRFDEAKDTLAAKALIGEASADEVLWLFSSMARVDPEKLAAFPVRDVPSAARSLRDLLALYRTQDSAAAEDLADQLQISVAESDDETAMSTAFFLALYFDSVRPDLDRRDLLLREVTTRDRHANEFVWYVARNGLGMAPETDLVLDAAPYEVMRMLDYHLPHDLKL